MNEQLYLFDDNTEYEQFEAKFKPKKTTDDCYTPPAVFEAIKDWACQEYGIDPACIVRPFFPGGDFLHFDYPEGCVVLDNPPFSILSVICEFYLKKGIPFFLFAPSLTSFVSRKNILKMNHIFAARISPMKMARQSLHHLLLASGAVSSRGQHPIWGDESTTQLKKQS